MQKFENKEIDIEKLKKDCEKFMAKKRLSEK